MYEVKNWKDIEGKEFHKTAIRQVFSGDKIMLVRNTINPGFPPFLHRHPHDQILTILEGNCEVLVGEKTFKMGPGDMLHVPANIDHDLRVIGDKPVINLDIFSPIREDYL